MKTSENLPASSRVLTQNPRNRLGNSKNNVEVYSSKAGNFGRLVGRRKLRSRSYTSKRGSNGSKKTSRRYRWGSNECTAGSPAYPAGISEVTGERQTMFGYIHTGCGIPAPAGRKTQTGSGRFQTGNVKPQFMKSLYFGLFSSCLQAILGKRSIGNMRRT